MTNTVLDLVHNVIMLSIISVIPQCSFSCSHFIDEESKAQSFSSLFRV